MHQVSLSVLSQREGSPPTNWRKLYSLAKEQRRVIQPIEPAPKHLQRLVHEHFVYWQDKNKRDWVQPTDLAAVQFFYLSDHLRMWPIECASARSTDYLILPIVLCFCRAWTKLEFVFVIACSLERGLSALSSKCLTSRQQRAAQQPPPQLLADAALTIFEPD